MLSQTHDNVLLLSLAMMEEEDEEEEEEGEGEEEEEVADKGLTKDNANTTH